MLEAMTTSGSARPSISATTAVLSSSSSGTFSCTNSAPVRARARSAEKERRDVEAPATRPTRSSSGHRASTSRRSRSSAPGAGSLATTSSPRERKNAAQRTPMSPVPTTATRPTSPGSGRAIADLLTCRLPAADPGRRGVPGRPRPTAARRRHQVARSGVLSRRRPASQPPSAAPQASPWHEKAPAGGGAPVAPPPSRAPRGHDRRSRRSAAVHCLRPDASSAVRAVEPLALVIAAVDEEDVKESRQNVERTCNLW